MSWLKLVLIALPIVALAVYLGLPRVLNAMGLHPHYDIPEYNISGKRALITMCIGGGQGIALAIER